MPPYGIAYRQPPLDCANWSRAWVETSELRANIFLPMFRLVSRLFRIDGLINRDPHLISFAALVRPKSYATVS